MKKFTTILFVLAALSVSAQNYGNPYKPVTNRNGMPQVEATAPASSFQSTSAMTGSGSSYSANPTLNTDGTASYNGAYCPTSQGPKRAKKGDDDFEDEGFGDNLTDPGKDPLGDAVLPLLLMALAFCGYVYFRKRKAQA